MATTVGKYIIFGNPTIAGTISGMGSLDLLQSSEYAQSSDAEEVRDIDGDVASKTFYNKRARLNLDWVLTSGTTATLTVGAVLTPGTTLAVVDSKLNVLTTTYMVTEEGVTLSTSNTGAARARISLERYIDGGVPV
jgi:hypothetical protein